MNDVLTQEIPGLIKNLGADNPFTRQHARLILVHLGSVSIPALLEALESANTYKRWEAARALGDMQGPQIPSALSNLLTDQDFSVRWVAMEGLIQHGREALPSLLEVFTKNFDSVWMREGVHHILHVLKDRHELKELEIKLFDILHQQAIPGFESGWTGEAAWAAEKALEALDRE